MTRPKKIANASQDFFEIIKKKIETAQYFITKHAQQRAVERGIPMQDILNILLGKTGYTRKWIQSEDEFKQDFIDEPPTWYYRVEGMNPDKENIRIILTFDDGLMPIITVIKL